MEAVLAIEVEIPSLLVWWKLILNKLNAPAPDLTSWISSKKKDQDFLLRSILSEAYCSSLWQKGQAQKGDLVLKRILSFKQDPPGKLKTNFLTVLIL